MADVFIMDPPAVLEPDRFRDAPHPREVLFCLGQSKAEARLLDAFRENRLHHALMFCGPEGIGKATLAYRFARFLLAHPDPLAPAVRGAVDLSLPEANPVVGQVARQAHPDLAVIRRGPTKDGKSLRAEIAVDDVRAALGVFRTTAGAGGWRIVVVDSVDDLNTQSANALLKMLEEPPPKALFLLIAHNPRAALPTIRSRCAKLPCERLSDGDIATALVRLVGADIVEARDAARDAEGSIRRAFAEIDPEAREVRVAAASAFTASGEGSRRKLVRALAERASGKAGAEAFGIILAAAEARLRDGVHGSDDAEALVARAELWEKLRRSAREIESYNLDRRPFVLSLFSDLAEIERGGRL
ncbi:MAG: DNA polymerase III subunit delta' [Beijerinckiaceae bacterium]